MKDTIYITGHKQPDTDSIASAISYAYLKQKQGFDCVPCRLGELNDETKYLLNRFGFESPHYLKDARVKIKDIELDPPYHVETDATIYEALQKMREMNLSYCAVTDPKNVLKGIITTHDIAKIGLDDTSLGIDLLKKTRPEDICKTIDGTMIYTDEKVHLNGKVSIVAITRTKIDHYEIRDRIVIIGDDPDVQKQLIKNGAGMLIAVWTKEIDEKVIKTAQKYHCPIIISGYGSMNTSRYLYFAPQVQYLMKQEVVAFNHHQLAEDVGRAMTKTRYRAYPVLDDEQKLIGYTSRYHIMSARNKKIILVDHNEFSQSVRAIEKAEVLEVLDHHRIRDFSTTRPVAFRNEIVGSTATIITDMFQERQIPIPKNMAGLLLGAVLSDTLKFQSPTTTQKDIFMANILAQIAQLDIDTFAHDMFEISTNISGKEMLDIIKTDMKTFDINDRKVLVSQVLIYDFNGVDARTHEIQIAMEQILNRNDAQTLVVCFTSITAGGSKFYVHGENRDWVRQAFPEGIQQGILSRKNQIIPILTETYERHE